MFCSQSVWCFSNEGLFPYSYGGYPKAAAITCGTLVTWNLPDLWLVGQYPMPYAAIFI